VLITLGDIRHYKKITLEEEEYGRCGKRKQTGQNQYEDEMVNMAMLC
jgi:hypothetical protein